MKTYLVIFSMLFTLTLTYAQPTFEYKYATSSNEMAVNLAEDGEGQLFIPICNYQNALIIKLDSDGTFLDSLHIINPEGTCRIEYLVKLDENNFAALGNWYTDSTAQIWFIKLNSDLDILIDQKLNSNNWHVTDFHPIINHRGNIVFIAAYYNPEFTGENVCMFEITTEGELVLNHYFHSPNYFNLPMALLENNFDYSYKVISTGRLDTLSTRLMCIINLVDSNFNFLDYEPVHSLDIQPRTSAQWLNDSLYMIAGKWLESGTNDWDIGILKLTSDDSVLMSSSFGKPDTTDWPANYKCVDFFSNQDLFLIGTSNTYEVYFQNAPSWIMINILDSNLSLKNQQFYGGDAYYNAMSILATQDSGCVISCTRYDYLSQADNYDVYILKVDKDGLMVTVSENQNNTGKICNVYPNPGQDIINIETPLNYSHIDLFDLTGQLLFSSDLSRGINTLNIGNLPVGIFLYRLFDKNYHLLDTGKWMKTDQFP